MGKKSKSKKGGNGGGKKMKKKAVASVPPPSSDDSPPPPPLPEGTGVVLLRSDIKMVMADVISFDDAIQSYQVKVRGAPPGNDDLLTLHKTLVSPITFRDSYRTNESHRKRIQQLSSGHCTGKYIDDLAHSIYLSDQVMYNCLYLADSGGDVMKTLPFEVHVPMVIEYYTSKSYSWLLPPGAAGRLFAMLKIYVDKNDDNDPFFQINNFPHFLDHVLTPGQDQDFIIGAGLLMNAAVYGMLEQVVGEDSSAQATTSGGDHQIDDGGDPRKTVEVLTTQIDALWSAYTWLTHTRNDHPGDLAKIRKCIDDTTFRAVGAYEQGYDHKTLLWCICCLYIQRCKDLRTLHPAHQGSRCPKAIDRLVECALTCVEIRGNCPHGYFIGSYLLMDTQEMCRPIIDQEPRHKLACEFALQSLELAKKLEDPFYLYHCHVLVAYWKMTSAYLDITDRGVSQREIRNQIKKAHRYKAQCQSYRVGFDFYRGEQTADHVLQMLDNWHEINPTWEQDDELPGPLSLASWET